MNIMSFRPKHFYFDSSLAGLTCASLLQALLSVNTGWMLVYDVINGWTQGVELYKCGEIFGRNMALEGEDLFRVKLGYFLWNLIAYW